MNSKTIWPVIHIESIEQVLDNVLICQSLEIDQIFLIHMNGQDELTDQCAERVRADFPRMRIGVNYLSLGAQEALERSLSLKWDATWVDGAGVSSQGASHEAQSISQLLNGTQHPFFAGVAFKYQKPEADPQKAALLAWQLGMIPTTSGARTGEPPQAEKLRTMKDGGDYPLAVASGLDPDNISNLAPWIDHALVATGVSLDFHHLDPRKLKQFQERFLTADKNIMLATQPKF